MVPNYSVKNTVTVTVQEVNLVPPSDASTVQLANVKTEPAQSIQLEDGTTGFLNQAVKGR